MPKFNPAKRSGRNGRKSRSTADQQHINELFERIRGSHSGSADRKALMGLLEPHYRPDGASGNDGVGNDVGPIDPPITSVDEFVQEVSEGIAALPADRRLEVRQKYWGMVGSMAADQSAKEYQCRDLLVNSKANNAYAAMFANRNKR